METGVDVVVITVIPPELTALREQFRIEQGPQKLPSGTNVWRSTMRSARDDVSYTVALACIDTAGNEDAGAATTELVMSLQPRIVVLVGIAAGMRGKLKIGEVVLSDRIVSYEPAALVDGDVEHRPEISRPPHTIRQDIAAYLSSVTPWPVASGMPEDWRPEVRLKKKWKKKKRKQRKREFESNVAQALSVKLSTFAAGEKLLKDASVFLTLRKLHGKIEVGEMEAGGMSKACDRLGCPWIAIRGISDFGDEFKDDRFHQFASRTAGLVAMHFLENGVSLAFLGGSRLPPRQRDLAVEVVDPAPYLPLGWNYYFSLSALDGRRHTAHVTLAAVPALQKKVRIDGRALRTFRSHIAGRFGIEPAALRTGTTRSDSLEVVLHAGAESVHWFQHMSGEVAMSIGVGDLPIIDLRAVVDKAVRFVRLCGDVLPSAAFHLYFDYQPSAVAAVATPPFPGFPNEPLGAQPDKEYRHTSRACHASDVIEPAAMLSELMVDRWRVVYNLPLLDPDEIAVDLGASVPEPAAASSELGDSSRATKYCISLVTDWLERASVKTWTAWTAGLVDIYPSLSVQRHEDIVKTSHWLLSRIWPEGTNVIRDALHNYRSVSSDFIRVFDEHAESSDGKAWRIPQFYRIPEWNYARYEMLGREWQYHVDLVADLGLELTRAANLVLDRIRANIDPLFASDIGHVQMLGPADEHFARGAMQPRYSAEQASLAMPYPGLDQFKKERTTRDFFFGAGTGPDDPAFHLHEESRRRLAWDDEVSEAAEEEGDAVAMRWDGENDADEDQ